MTGLSRRELVLLHNWLAPPAKKANGSWCDVARSLAGASLQARTCMGEVEVRVVARGAEVAGRITAEALEALAAPQEGEGFGWTEGAACSYFIASLRRTEHRFPVPHRRSRSLAPVPLAVRLEQAGSAGMRWQKRATPRPQDR